MIARLLAQLLEPSEDLRDEVTSFLATYQDPRDAWMEARGRRRAAEGLAQWSADIEWRHRSLYWRRVMSEIERQTGYRHQPQMPTLPLDQVSH
jgi:hypothetical protein